MSELAPVRAVRVAARQPLADRLFVRGLDLVPVLALVLTSLNSQGAVGVLASPATKTLSSALALFVAIALLIREEARPPAPRVLVLVALLAAVLVFTSLFRDLPVQRYLLLGQYLTLAVALGAWMCVRPDRLIGILFTTGAAHLVLAEVFPTRVPWINGQERLSGGSHPIQLGFEASFVVVVALVAVVTTPHRRLRAFYGVLTAYAAYILTQAFARESLIAVSVAVVVLAMMIPGPFRWVRAYLAVIGFAVVLALLGIDGVVSLLGADRLSDLSSATGRTDIWARILAFLPQFVPFGFGYSALNDDVGPDRAVYFASGGAPAENAVLQVLLDGGVPGLVVWLAYLVVAVRIVLRSRSSARLLGIATLPLFAATLLVSSTMSGTGVTWWYFLAVAAECSLRRRGPSTGTVRRRSSLARAAAAAAP